MSQFQKQPPEVFYRKSCSQKFRNIHRKAPVLESPFNRLAGFKTCNFLKKRLRHRCFNVNTVKFLRTLILMKICEQLLLPFLLLTVSGRLLSHLKKRKISRNGHSLSFDVPLVCLFINDRWKRFCIHF